MLSCIIPQDTAAAVAEMSKQLTDMANERLPGKEADRPAKPSAPLRQRLQQSWQGKVGSPDSPKTGGFARASDIPKHLLSVDAIA
jgi:hypothetical protein